MDADWRIEFGGRVLVLGCGAVSRCLQPLLLRHLDMDFRDLAVMDMADLRAHIPSTLATGARYVQHRLTRQDYARILGTELRPGDVLINLTWDIDSCDLLSWCHDHGVRYVDTSIETWASNGDADTPVAERTTYRRHLRLYELARRLDRRGPTAVVEHGANPGLVSHLTKRALHDVATTMLAEPERLSRPLAPARRERLEHALHDHDHARLAMETGTRAIHISERDTQISRRPRQVGEFVNTWSVKGFYEEGTAPAELGWGTHERILPPSAVTHDHGPRNQIFLARTGMSTWVRSWVPSTGPFIGLLISHGETFTISDHLTVWHDGTAAYRPTVHFAYLATDAGMASLHECRMHGYQLQQRHHIMGDDILDGADELGVLLLGHELNGWWTGSRLDIHQARSLVPGQNATTLQVAASVLGALRWIVRNPKAGLCVPDDLDHDEVLAAAKPYLGECPSVPTDWTPHNVGADPLAELRDDTPDTDPWQFHNILVS